MQYCFISETWQTGRYEYLRRIEEKKQEEKKNAFNIISNASIFLPGFEDNKSSAAKKYQISSSFLSFSLWFWEAMRPLIYEGDGLQCPVSVDCRI